MSELLVSPRRWLQTLAVAPLYDPVTFKLSILSYTRILSFLHLSIRSLIFQILWHAFWFGLFN